MSKFNYQKDDCTKNIDDRLTQAYTELEALTNSIPGGVAKVLFDGNNIILNFASNGFYNLGGYTKEEFNNLFGEDKLCKFINCEDFTKLINSLKEQNELKNPTIPEFRIIKRDGTFAWIMAQGNIISCENGIYTAICIFTDITELKKAQQKLEMNEERYRIVAEISDDYLFEYDIETDTMYYTEKYAKRFDTGLILENFGVSMKKRDFIYSEDWPLFEKIYERLIKGETLFTEKYRVKEVNGEIKWYSICFTTIYDANNVPLKSIGKITDIDAQKKETDKLRERAQRDSMTKLSNKSTTKKLIQKYISEDTDANHALMIIDVDNFKKINDTFGHMMGDYVLVEMASKLKKIFRSTDVMGRIGGDEFLVMLRGIYCDSLINEKANAICKLFRSICVSEDADYKITGSIGISVYPKDGTTYEELLKKADEALYNAKKSGKDQFKRYGE